MNKTEEYLDSLLNNISPEKKAEEEQKKRKRANANFSAQFEKEVNDADMEKFIRDFEIEVDEDNTKAKEDEPAADSNDFWNNLEGIVKNANGTSEPVEPSEPMESEPESEPEATGTDFEINTLDDDAWTEQKTETSEAEGSEEQPQRSKEEQDLLDMIADLPSDEELSGLAESLRTDGQNDEADLNKMETRGTEEAETALTEEDTAKADKKEKKGFFKKLVSVLFGESEEDELPEKEETSEAEEAAVPPEDFANMSEENRQILEELNAAGKAKEEDKPEDKEDKKKEKKAKKKRSRNRKRKRNQKKEEKRNRKSQRKWIFHRHCQENR